MLAVLAKQPVGDDVTGHRFTGALDHRERLERAGRHGRNRRPPTLNLVQELGRRPDQVGCGLSRGRNSARKLGGKTWADPDGLRAAHSTPHLA